MNLDRLDVETAARAVEKLLHDAAVQVVSDSRRVEAYLSDLLPQNRREANILLLAAKSNVLSSVVSMSNPSTASNLTRNAATQKLVDSYGVRPEIAAWAISVWILGASYYRGDDGAKFDLPTSYAAATPTRGARTPVWRRIAFGLAIVALTVAVTVQVVDNSPSEMSITATSAPASSSVVVTQSKQPSDLDNWIAAGNRGPVELTVSANWLETSTIGDDTSVTWCTILLRVTVKNHSPREVNLAPESRSLVVISTKPAGSAVPAENAFAPFDVLFSRFEQPVYAHPVTQGSWTNTPQAGPAKTFEWRGGSLAGGGVFTGSKDENGAFFILPMPAGYFLNEPTVHALGVVGVGVVDANGGLLGFVGTDKWGVNDRDAFFSLPN